ncbi:SCO family protein [Variovorax sp. DT-64]|uniref:SCO family protein n=1 Tax=Variovorax sp. DT-64 TaxID=3396160 RepID=UPI003F1989FD
MMFTGCSTVCPIQGALFAALQAAMAAEHSPTLRLLSLSIDPLADDPAALSAWLRRFGAGPAWSAAVPTTRRLRTCSCCSRAQRPRATVTPARFTCSTAKPGWSGAPASCRRRRRSWPRFGALHSRRKAADAAPGAASSGSRGNITQVEEGPRMKRAAFMHLAGGNRKGCAPARYPRRHESDLGSAVIARIGWRSCCR